MAFLAHALDGSIPITKEKHVGEVELGFAILSGVLQLVSGGDDILNRLGALQQSRAAAGKELTLADLEAEFTASELAAVGNLAIMMKAKAAQDASKSNQ